MARIDVKLSDVLDSAVAKLRTGLSLNERTCFWALENFIPTQTPSGVWLVLTPDGGTFDKDKFEGGGREQLTTDTAVVVNINSMIKLDSSGHDDRALFDTSRGMLEWLHDILDEMTGADLETGDPEVGLDTFMRELLQPEGFSKPERNNNNLNVCSMSVAFRLQFDWALT